jgi:hypothetical protein
MKADSVAELVPLLVRLKTLPQLPKLHAPKRRLDTWSRVHLEKLPVAYALQTLPNN